MAEQSSAAVAVRALVMLGCLVAIPLVAVFGNALPEVIDQIIGTWWTPSAPVVSEGVAEAPLFDPLGGNSPQAPMAPPSFAPDWVSERSIEPAPADSAECDTQGCRVLPATYEASLETGPDQHLAPAAPPFLGHGISSTAVPYGPSAKHSSDQFQSICQRLKELGATYVLLESWGDGQEQFRFYCKIAIAGNPHYTYRFEATNPDPLAAMANVLRQVESWQASRYGN